MIGQKIIFKDSLDSTNNYVAKLLSLGELKSGTVIMAGEQTHGRGQRGNVWETEQFKNLIFSTYVEYANLSVHQQSALSQWVSLALCHALEDFGIRAKIKWPNDLVVGNQKIAGILIENQLKQNQLISSIIGIGLNVNQIAFNLTNITSMKLCLGRDFEVDQVAFQLIQRLNELSIFIQSQRFYDLKNSYLQKMWLFDTWSLFNEPGQEVFEGKIMDVNDSGQLVMITRNQEIKTYSMKEIEFTLRNTPVI